MGQILVNSALALVWLALTVGLVRLIHQVGAEGGLSPVAAVLAWLVGQLVILSPIVLIAWRRRKDGAAEGA